jgi:ATP-dependent RNA helicase RhlB
MKKQQLRKTNRRFRQLLRTREKFAGLLAVSPNSAGDPAVPVTLPVKNKPEVKSKVQDAEPQKVAKPKPVTEVKQEPNVKYRRPRQQRKEKPKWDLDSFQVDPLPGKSRFHDFDLPLSLMRAIADLDFKYCTPIQAKALPDALDGKDMVARASTGTGKSAVFLVALFARLLRNRQAAGKPGTPRALIIAPTRELVMQIAKDGQQLAKYTGLRIVAVYGGTDYKKQMALLDRGKVDVVVATPGRLLDFAGRNVVRLHQVGTMIIDEADRMLDMGFIPDVRRIIGRTPKKEERQTLLFSATITPEVKHLAAQWCVKPLSLETEVEQVAVDTVEQIVYMTTTAEKYNVLYNTITASEHDRIIVFTNMKSEARKLYDRLRRNDINCTLLTGDVPQQKRQARLERFREGEVDVLIATDVAGRGIHIDGISHVFNYTLPYEPEDYVHRIGRTGRAGKSGISISFADEEGAFYLPEIEEYIGKTMPCLQPDESLLLAPPKGRAPDKKKPGQNPPRKKKRRRY